MRDLKCYSAREWLRIKPLDHFLIDVCNDALQYAFRVWKPRALTRFFQDVEHLRGGNMGLVVAYQQPWVLEWLLRMASRHLSEGTLLVFDNSRKAKSRTDIERVCRDYGVPYLALPPSPTYHPNRSHGMAMTWIFYNVVRTIRPRVFSYIDHDLIPLERTKLARGMGDQPFFGLPYGNKRAWALWAGYCSYNFSSVHHLPMNFLNDFPRGLDTGGRNWSCLYKSFDQTKLRHCTQQQLQIKNPFLGSPQQMMVLDGSWLHLGGASYSADFQERFRFYEYLSKSTDGGATLKELVLTDSSNGEAV